MGSRRGYSYAASVVMVGCTVLLFGCAGLRNKDVVVACGTPLDPRVANSCVVAPQALWRGGKPDAVAAAALVELDVKTVVNLELAHDDQKSFQEAAFSLTGRREIDYFRIRDWEPLTVLAPDAVDDHVAHFLAITRRQPKPIYVHCRSGQNRTGVMIAAYRVFGGMSAEDAIAEMERYKGVWFDADAKYIRSLTPERRANIEKQIETWIPRLRREAQFVCADGRCSVSSGR